MTTWRYPNIEQNPRQVPLEQPLPPYKYIRTNFLDAGTDNFAEPPAQDPMMMTQLKNVQPIVNGQITRRWGYTLWNPTMTAAAQLIDYQSDLTLARNVIATTLSGSTPVIAYNDDGSIYNSSIFQPVGGQTVRAVTSRSFAYFSDGQALDYKKWDGKASSTATNWGIDVNNSTTGAGSGSSGPRNSTVATDLGTSGTQNTSQGPNNCATGADSGSGGTAWVNPANITVSGQQANVNLIANASSNFLNASNFSFTLPSNATVLGVTASYNAASTGAGAWVVDQGVYLLKAGAQTGSNHAVAQGWQGTLSYGGSTDLWGAAWLYSDINNNGFGVALQLNNTNNVTSKTGFVTAFVTLTVYYSIPTSSFSWTNPTNVEGNSAYATATATNNGTSIIRTNTYGFSGLGGVTITGIQVNATCFATGGVNPTLQIALDKASALYTTFSGQVMPGSSAVLTFGGAGNLWGGTWSGTDIDAAGFGVELYCITTSGSSAVSVKNVTITVFYTQSAMAIATSSTGITVVVGRIYAACFTNVNTGHISDVYPTFSASTGPLTNQGIQITNIPVSNDTQVTHTVILATADGGDETRLYFVAQLTAGTTSYLDQTPETTLLANNVYLSTNSAGQEFGIALNDPPANLNTNGPKFPIKHRGNLYMTSGPTLYWSKGLSDVTTDTGFVAGKWEESWPATNQLDVSELAESVRGLLSDGINLYIGTEFKIRRINGSAPFEESPDIVHNEVGLMNQDVWRIVYAMGTPVGSIWLTPDLRIILSDFNTYQDISVPIQTTLQTINTNVVANTAFASFYSNGPYDLYILAVPTGTNTSNDTVLVYNTQTQHWFVWQLADQIDSMLYHIQVNGQSSFIMGSVAGPLYRLTPNTTQDRIGNTPVSYPVVAQTSWLDMTEPTMRKALNEIELLTDDPTMTVTVEGASLHSEFSSPNTVVSNAPLTKGPFGNFKVYLAGQKSRDRYYRFTMTSPVGNVVNVLESLNVEAIPMNRL